MPNEPVTGLIGCHTAVGYRIYNLDLLLREMLQSQTCFMAKDQKGNIIGIAFCTVILKKDDTTIHELPTRDEYLCQGWPVDFTHILLLLDHLGYHPNIMNDKKVNQLLDIFAVVVKPNYRRMGIATQLITKAITEAQLVDIPLVTVVCTSAFTQRCCAKLGFNAENTIFYKDWHYKNIKIFDNNKIDPVHPAAISYYKYI
jgi:GNAT superfamily N-acetyltransferase